MQCITKRSIAQLAQVRLHALIVVSVVVLAVMGPMPDSQAGWIHLSTPGGGGRT